MRRASDALVATTIGGRYRVVAPLGRGGAGHVYLAIQEPLGREVALKVLRTDIDEDSREEFAGRFLREAAVTSRLRHPNLVTIHDFGTIEGGQPYVVMERLRGRTLAEHLADGPFAPEEAARIGAALARGLRHAHGEGLVHRDVKPRNIVLEPDESGLRPVLLDFGLVKARVEGDSVETRVGTYMGTPAYMAPEQSKAVQSLDGRADLYALGCVLYKMLTGLPPFEANDALGMAVAHINDPYPPMAQRVPGLEVPEGLEAIVRRCLEKDPEDRYAHGGELAEALDVFRNQSEVGLTALPERPTRRGPWIALAVVGLLGLLGAGGSLVLGLVVGTGAMFMAGPGREAPAEISEDQVAGTGAGEPTLQSMLEARQAEDPAASPGADPDAQDPQGEAEDPPAEKPAPKPLTAAPKPPPSAPKPVPSAPKPVPVAPKPAAVAPKPAPVAPKPAPVASPAPAPPPAPVVIAPKPAPAASPPAPSAPVAFTVDGVDFTAAHAQRALTFVNEATEQQLEEAGVYRRGVSIILERRPFESLQAFGDTYQIGTKTVEAIRDASR